ncbi:MAG: hypothetical protein OEY61_09510 [Gammaproteobacteria bacterium]|nr:hypothetical protein [Gammaproteobacteria bacterium]
MSIKITIWPRIFFLISLSFFSSQAWANCTDVCENERNDCSKTASQQHISACDEQFNICNLSCKREQTKYCVYLGFKNYDGVADKENELKEIVGDFSRVTEERHPNFAGLCRSNDMKCEYVLDWDGTMYSCGGEIREPRRVACCR